MYTLFTRLALILFSVTALLLMNACGSAPERFQSNSGEQTIEKSASKQALAPSGSDEIRTLGEIEVTERTPEGVSGELVECVLELPLYEVVETELGVPSSFVKGEQYLSARSTFRRFEEQVEELKLYELKMQPHYYATLVTYSERLKEKLAEMNRESTDEEAQKLKVIIADAMRTASDIALQLEGDAEGRAATISALSLLEELGIFVK